MSSELARDNSLYSFVLVRKLWISFSHIITANGSVQCFAWTWLSETEMTTTTGKKIKLIIQLSLFEDCLLTFRFLSLTIIGCSCSSYKWIDFGPSWLRCQGHWVETLRWRARISTGSLLLGWLRNSSLIIRNSNETAMQGFPSYRSFNHFIFF